MEKLKEEKYRMVKEIEVMKVEQDKLLRQVRKVEQEKMKMMA